MKCTTRLLEYLNAYSFNLKVKPGKTCWAVMLFAILILKKNQIGMMYSP